MKLILQSFENWCRRSSQAEVVEQNCIFFSYQMAFKIPTIPPLNRQEDTNLPKFVLKNVNKGSCLGRGAFATAYFGKYNGEDIVLKELNCKEWDLQGKKFLKEARIMNKLPMNENIVAMTGVCYEPLTIMLEYCCFDFAPFSKNTSVKVNSLDQYLKFVDTFDVKGFEQFSIKCATDIIKGVSFLHTNKIAHRDLKPSNVLVCNRHYSQISDTKVLEEVLSTSPIICKLADFGESRSDIYQTNTLLSTKSDNTDKGTIPYMAPEILPGGNLRKPTLDDLFKVDIWALGMTLFSLMNADVRYPFMLEKVSANISADRFESFIGKKLNIETELPSMSDKYALTRWQEWHEIFRLYFLFTQINPSNRISLNSENVDLFLSGRGEVEKRSLLISQESAMVEYSEEIAKGNNPPYPLNDGTNACSFLCYKFLITLALFYPAKSLDSCLLDRIAKKTIVQYPKKINLLRDISKSYDIEDVKALITKIDSRSPKCELLEFCSPGSATVFSTEGIKDLVNALQSLGQRDIGLAIYISDPYSFAIYSNNEQYLLFDTHPVPNNCGGNQTAQLLKTCDKSFSSVINLCCWILKRLALSSQKTERHQSMTVLDIKEDEMQR